jgi:spore coat protein U-like protein
MKKILIAVAALVIAPAAYAVNCSWRANPTNINFGTYSVFGGAVTGTSSFGIRCSPPGSATVTLSRGGSPTFARYMAGTVTPANTLGYNLFLDAATLNTWGDGTSGTQYTTFTPTPGNTDITLTIFGKIPANLDAPPGTYMDTIQVSMNWDGNVDSRFFTVQAIVDAECTVATTPLNFGNYDPVVAHASTPNTNTSLVNVYCTKGTFVSVTLDNGLYAIGAARRMRAPSGDLLNYEMYKDASRTITWNTTNTNTGTASSKLTAINGGFTVYGRIPAAQDVRAGSYSDMVQVTVNY